ncbi:uncharacterized protein [Solanum lycopersicum]|uniref:Heparan-alpha-glucosaminide N-acetyltransferase catalytic domain-containing protein n=1 Tax=Solanum lycopersicum TaxID=4081 RepID=A0A3Q7IIL4_SOLLC|nr:heparan-alpha-glucosaminide N-acetyltransferase [Solanum lycopersicum]XP_010327400.1 heparan-alpha-glucosaminide N-acetyltransferase [Solanum lycopersicum]XP_010327401.1 heparan-alpha-glucosaminide N-acetyltransferase [Solanum lycopersicum]XP_010327402.1 heparan-alpha-glucosaminide N-acetyltransferase [Solanum lycopersicum]XP_010327403.1 heparan-alpha-glucosaminide N-acetyltransferase [Solanum lycopersicum]XP_010327404.1 heparan-alpha-glucosaminide N-acetyltransferase [Solanum lycopersicum]
MAENEPLLGSNNGGEVVLAERESEATQTKTTRIVSLDVFRGLCVFLMILVDYAGSVFPSIAHSPWNGVRLADFVMPFFLFVVGVSVAIVNKIVLDRTGATMKVVIRTLKLFILGIFLQGGYLHGITGLTYGVDIERIRWMGILQRIAVGYIVAALCEVWLPCQEMKRFALFRNYICQWFIMFLLSAIHCGLLYGLYVPDWQFSVSQSTGSTIYEVKCSVRGDLGPACNSAGMIDRYILGLDHLYTKPVYRNMKECNGSNRDTVSESMPSWCHATFDPEGIVSSLTAAATSIIGLQYGHILVQFQDHKGRLYNWSILSLSLLVVGLFLDFIGMPLNKSLYTISYMLVTSAAGGITFCLLYLLVDIYGWRRLMFVLEWMGKHSLSIFILITSNIAVIFIQGFYWRDPENNIIRWIVTRFVQK